MNWGMIGHQWAINLLKDQAAHDAYRHAYLITGPKGVGRRTLGLRLTQSLNCPQPISPGEPCLECRTCTQIERMQYPDLAVVQSEPDGKTLKVDQIRTLQHDLFLSPYEAHFRVALLLRFEEASLSAANALLKTLEEPPPQVILVITADSREHLLPTIVSRCEVLRLRPLALDDLSKGLQSKWSFPSEQAKLMAHISGGRPGYALRLYNEPQLINNRNIWLDDLQYLLTANLVERFSFAESLAKDKDALHEVLHIWLSYWRDVLIVSIHASIQLTNLDREKEIKNLAQQLSADQARQIVSRLERTLESLSRNANSRLVTEVLLLDLPRI